MSEHLLSVKDLRTSFVTDNGEVHAVNGVSFNLDRGKVLGIVGESGSGKSVTAYSIMQILADNGRITGGSVEYKGQDITKWTARQMAGFRGKCCSIIFQDPMTSLNPVFTIGNQLEEAILLHTNKNKAQAKERAIEMLTLVGVNEPAKRVKQYPYELSGGMRQRVMIAMALACEPDILIADEPTTALDVTIQAQILELMKELQQKLGMAIIMVTHDLGVIATMCDEIMVMYGGRVCERGTADDIFYNPRHEYTKGLLRSIPSTERMKERLGTHRRQPHQPAEYACWLCVLRPLRQSIEGLPGLRSHGAPGGRRTQSCMLAQRPCPEGRGGRNDCCRPECRSGAGCYRLGKGRKRTVGL